MPEPVYPVPLGRTPLHVSRICFGTSALGDMPDTYGYQVSEQRAEKTLDAILKGPTNFLDTSRNYGAGRAEMLIGAAIRRRGGLPKGFIISSKLDRDPDTNRLDAAQVRRSLDESLAALGLERIALLHLHDPEHAASLDDITKPSGALAELFKIRDEGLTDAVGLAAGNTRIMLPILRAWDFDALITHNRFTLINRNAEPMLDFAQQRGIAALNAAPYNSGILAKGPQSAPRFAYQAASAATLSAVDRIEKICNRHKIPLGAAALQFSLRDRRITSTICGVTRPERVQQTLDWSRYPIPEDAWRELLALPFARDDPEATREYRPG